MKKIQILKSHYNDFLAHPGWWAVMQDPELKPGEEFLFTFSAAVHEDVKAQVRDVAPPGSVGVADDFTDWYVIHYTKVREAIRVPSPFIYVDDSTSLSCSAIPGHYMHIGDGRNETKLSWQAAKELKRWLEEVVR